MTFLFRLLLFIHIFSVILSIGPFFILVPMLRKLRNAEHETKNAYLDAFRFSIRLAKHAGHVLVVSGLLLVITGSIPWTTSWLDVTILIMLASLFFLARAFTPILRKSTDFGNEILVNKLRRAIWIYIVLLSLMLWFMVTKPVLW